MISPARRFTMLDYRSWLHNAAFFGVPVLLLYLGNVEINLATDGFAWSDFVPSIFTQGAIFTYAVKEIMAAAKKWYEETDYQK